MAITKKEKEELITLGIEELSKFYYSLNDSYDQIRIKALALIAGEVAIVSFIFSSEFVLPKVVYGIVFYSIGVTLLGIAFLSFLWIISPVRWSHPTDLDAIDDMHNRFNSKEKFLAHIKKQHLISIDKCMEKLNRKAIRFIWAIYLLCIGIFILLLIKFGGGKV